jgi:adenylate cyclase
MGIEIERKFLLIGDAWRENARGILLRQGYISSQPERTVRVRTSHDQGYLTVKGKTTGITRCEFEYPIPFEEANILLYQLCKQPILEKIRYQVDYKGFKWEIDEFLGDNAGLFIAEIELEAEDHFFAKPEWAGQEVSGDTRYFNSSLSRNPFLHWKKE